MIDVSFSMIQASVAGTARNNWWCVFPETKIDDQPQTQEENVTSFDILIKFSYFELNKSRVRTWNTDDTFWKFIIALRGPKKQKQSSNFVYKFVDALI